MIGTDPFIVKFANFPGVLLMCNLGVGHGHLQSAEAVGGPLGGIFPAEVVLFQIMHGGSLCFTYCPQGRDVASLTANMTWRRACFAVKGSFILYTLLN